MSVLRIKPRDCIYWKSTLPWSYSSGSMYMIKLAKSNEYLSVLYVGTKSEYKGR